MQNNMANTTTRWPITADYMSPNLTLMMRLRALVNGLFGVLLFIVELCSELFETEVLSHKLVPIPLVPASRKSNLLAISLGRFSRASSLCAMARTVIGSGELRGLTLDFKPQ